MRQTYDNTNERNRRSELNDNDGIPAIAEMPDILERRPAMNPTINQQANRDFHDLLMFGNRLFPREQQSALSLLPNNSNPATVASGSVIGDPSISNAINRLVANNGDEIPSLLPPQLIPSGGWILPSDNLQPASDKKEEETKHDAEVAAPDEPTPEITEDSNCIDCNICSYTFD